MIRTLASLLLAAAALAAPPAASATEFDREAVIGYLLDNPDVILEAIDRYEGAQKVAAHRDALFATAGDPVGGNPDGRIVLVEFSDYNCPYCRAMLPALKRLMAEEPELRLVYKEMPILAPESWYAAQVALTANEQGLYGEFHEAMFGVGARNRELVDTIAELVGVDVAAGGPLTRFDPQINANLGLGQDLGTDGTPTFVIGSRILVGDVGYDTLKAAIEAERARLGL
ncbi:MAG: DsbA family protein [Alphaproteobacteria bacterium]